MALIRFPLDELIGDGLVRETEFREQLNRLNVEPYRGQAVLLPWIHHLELPIWVYLMAVAKLSSVVAVLSFGEACSPVTLLQRGRISDSLETGKDSPT